MDFFNLNSGTIAQGNADFRKYARGVLCGAYDREGYAAAMRRPGGLKSLPGAVMALIEFGIDDREGIIHAASRITRCNRDNVTAFLEAFTGDEPDRHLFFKRSGGLAVHHATRLHDFPEAIFAA